MENLDGGVLTLDWLIQLQGEEVRKRGMEDGRVRTLMNLGGADEFDSLVDYTSLQRPQYPPFRVWDD